ncbi:MAG: MCE family protein [Planctomycetes bacterium]|nr:MCE family protein [Planctomycetota bacterium]
MKSRDLIAGILIFVCVGVALYFAMSLKGDGSFRLPWETREVRYRIQFPSVAGLDKNAPVWISGVPKGRVMEMVVDPGVGTVDVFIMLDPAIKLRADCYAEIVPASVFGGKAISLYLGSAKEDHDPETTIRGEIVEDLFTAAGRGIGKINEGIDYAVATIKDVNAIVKDVKDGRGPVGMILRDEKVAGDISATAENIRLASEDTRGITGNVRDITEKMNSGEGVAALLLEDADTALRFKNIVRNIEDASDNTVGASRSIKNIVQKVDSGRGFFGVLLNDDETGENVKSAVAKAPELMDSIKRATDEAGTLVEKVNRGEGTVGKLFNDDSLFNDTLNAINTLRSGFEDIREQAPITTFASLLFQVFQ